MIEIIVAERDDTAAAQLSAGPEAGVREFVDQQKAVLADQRGDDTGIGEIARTKHAGSLRAFDLGKLCLQNGKQRVIAGHKARCAGTDTISVDRRFRGSFDGGMGAKIQIVVATEREQASAASLNPDHIRSCCLNQ